MQIEIVRDSNGEVLAAIDLSDSIGVAPEVVLEEGYSLEVIEARRSEVYSDLDGTLRSLSGTK